MILPLMILSSMPIELSIPIRAVTQDEFHAIDRVMLGQAFMIHNEYGNLLNERNFRPLKVRREFVSTHLNHDLRRRFTVTRRHWPEDAVHQRLFEVAHAFCADIGLGLDLPLYRQAFLTLTGVPSTNRQCIDVLSGERVVHQHKMHLVAEDVGFAVTAIPALNATRQHLQRLVNHTRLRGIAWINLPLHELHFEFLERQNHGG